MSKLDKLKSMEECNKQTNCTTSNSTSTFCMSNEGSENVVKCHDCDRKYKSIQSLRTHQHAKHKSTMSNGKMPCLEKDCSFRAWRIRNLIFHLIRCHEKKFDCEKVTLQCHEEFWDWKTNAEDRCKSSYFAVSSVKESAFGDKKLYLYCSRSGYARGSESDFNMSSRSRSSRKINGMCTSFMEVNFSKEGETIVNFCKTHYGHKPKDDGTDIKMNNEERCMIRDLIGKGLDASEIISVMKSRLPQHRHHFLKYFNIRNIAVKGNLHLHRKKSSSFRMESVSEKDVYQRMKNNGEIVMDLQVENEVEIEADDMVVTNLSLPIINWKEKRFQSSDCTKVDAGGSTVLETNFSSPACYQETSFGTSGAANDYRVNLLREKAAEKAKQISRLSLGLISETALMELNEKLDSILCDFDSKEHIEVIADSEESFDIEEKFIIS